MDTRIILVDQDDDRSITNDAERVVRQLNENIRGGIGHRNVYYRDTDGRFDELVAGGGIGCWLQRALRGSTYAPSEQ